MEKEAVWRVGNAFVVARRDGWVEIAIDSPRQEYLSMLERREALRDTGFSDLRLRPGRQLFSPAELLAWLANGIDTSRRDNWLPELKAGITIWSNNSAADPRWSTYLRTRCGEQPIEEEMPHAPQRLYAILDSAARKARGFHPDEPIIDPAVPRDESAVACPASVFVYDVIMPSASHSSIAPPETMARFVIRADGTIDTSNVVFHPSLQRDAKKRALEALSKWRFRPATLRDRNVAQLSFAPITFLDAATRDTLVAARNIEAPEWSARSDGLVEWLHPRDKRLRALFEPQDVLEWTRSYQRLKAEVPGSPREIRNEIPILNRGFVGGPGLPLSNASRWNATLGEKGAMRLSAELYWKISDPGTPARTQTAVLTCNNARVPIHTDDPAGTESVREAHEAAVAALARAPLRNQPEEMNRIVGELEVNCAARRAAALDAVVLQDEQMIARLSLPRDILASFVVSKGGRVETNSIHLFGTVNAGDRSRIVDELEKLRFQPGKILSEPVRQRAHLMLRAAPYSRFAADPLIKESCATAGRLAVTTRVRYPEAGAPRSIVERLTSMATASLNTIADTTKLTGTLDFVVLPGSKMLNFTWRGLPSSIEGYRRQEFIEQPLGFAAPALPLGFQHPLGLTMTMGERC